MLRRDLFHGRTSPLLEKESEAPRSRSPVEREELVRLHRQLRQVQMERDTLAKATVWLAVRRDEMSCGPMNS
jgi:hypothetical protein